MFPKNVPEFHPIVLGEQYCPPKKFKYHKVHKIDMSFLKMRDKYYRTFDILAE